MPHQVFNVEEAAEYLHLASQDVSKLVLRGEIPYHRQGGRVVFRRSEIDAWASQRILGLGESKLRDYHRTSSAKTHNLAPDYPIISELLKADYIDPALPSKTKSSVMRDMIALADRTGLVNYPEDLLTTLEKRERLCSTALAGGLALLHPQHHDPYLFEDSFILFCKTVQPIPFGSPDGRTTDLFFLVCCQDERIHLHVLARLCMMCYQTELLLAIRERTTAGEIMRAFEEAEARVIKRL